MTVVAMTFVALTIVAMTFVAMTDVARTVVAMMVKAMAVAASRKHVQEVCDMLHMSEVTLEDDSEACSAAMQ